MSRSAQFQPSARPVQPPDGQDLSGLSNRMLAVAEEIGAMAPELAKARVIKEAHSDRLKRALAMQVREFLAAGDSASAAETKGRASVKYGEELDRLTDELHVAESTISAFAALNIQFDAVRSALAALRTIGNTY